ncbi:MAG: aspartate kinase [Firmicutes bacterium]|nr:aspartate kinase [Bacillota bacterium]
MAVNVRVPATSANMGPGFDALGIALNLYNYLEVEEGGEGLNLEIGGEGESRLPRDERNLIVSSMRKVFERTGYRPKGLRIRATNNIPLTRGLGSSAAAIVAGLVAANELAGAALSTEDLLNLATEIEGHPDNVAPALLGGFVISTVESGRVRYMRLEPPLGSNVLVVIPDKELRTEEARAVLPQQVPMEDAIFNISRAAALVGGLVTGRSEVLEWATEDRLHQQYRSGLAPELKDAIEAARRAGAKGAAVSGSGPSLLVFTDGHASRVKAAILEVFTEKGVPCRIMELGLDLYGARLVAGNTPAPIVQKYGGSSVADPDRVKNVARRVAKAHEQGNRVVVVVSAMGRTTDELIEIARQVSSDPGKREMDVLLATGEQVSIALLCMALNDLGVPAVSMTGAQVGIITDRSHTKAKIQRIDRETIMRHLDQGKVVVVAGFQGVDPSGDVTTLGRGGSDTTAVALAAALGASSCEIFTDVDGVFTADPRIEPSARLIPEIPYDEMAEMAGLGAKVMQLRSIEFGRRYGVAILVRNSMNDNPGTWIREAQGMEEPLVRAITHNADEIKIVLKSVPDVPGIAARVFRSLAREKVRLDMIIQSIAQSAVNDIAFTVSREDLPSAKLAAESICREIGGKELVIEDDVGKVSVVGAGITQDASIAADMFEALAEIGINIQMISTSGSRISCIIDRKRLADAVRALHKRFELAG